MQSDDCSPPPEAVALHKPCTCAQKRRANERANERTNERTKPYRSALAAAGLICRWWVLNSPGFCHGAAVWARCAVKFSEADRRRQPVRTKPNAVAQTRVGGNFPVRRFVRAAPRLALAHKRYFWLTPPNSNNNPPLGASLGRVGFGAMRCVVFSAAIALGRVEFDGAHLCLFVGVSSSASSRLVQLCLVAAQSDRVPMIAQTTLAIV